MISPRDLYVRAGDLVIPAWRKLVECLASLPVLPGVGVLVTRTPHGTVVNSRAFMVGFTGSWAMGGGSLDAGEIAIGDGYVNATVPFVGELLLMPKDAKATRPKLKVDQKLMDESGRSWICLEAEVDADGKPIKKRPFRIVQAKHPYFTDSALIGRTPLAVMLGRDFHRLAYFDLQYRFDAGKKKHFFFV